MAPMTATIATATPAIEHCRLLPERRPEWPSGAQSAYRGVLDELDAWCRNNDAPRGLNSWIAEEAVRRSA